MSTRDPGSAPVARVTGNLRWASLVAGMAALAALAVWMRYRPLGASSLWLDDAWVAVGSKVPTLGDTIRAGLTSPGFSLLYRAWAAVFGHDATTAQLLALIFGVACPVVLFLACAERGLSLSAAFLGGVLMATAPAHIEFSTRLKQYSAEALAATLVLWVAWRVIDRPADGRPWVALTAVALGASFLSAIGVVLSLSALAVAFLTVIVARPRNTRPAIVSIGIYGVVVTTWMLLAVRPNLYAQLTNYWRGHYLEGRGFAGGLGRHLADVARSFQDAESTIILLMLLVAAGIVLVRRPLVGCLLMAPTFFAVLLAGARIAPLGTGRTDIYLFPSYALLIAVAWTEVAALLPIRRLVIGGLAVACAGVIALNATPAASNGYPLEDLTPLVHLVEKRRQPGDAIAVYSSAGFAYALGTRFPVTTEPDPRAATNWSVRIHGPNITVLPAYRDTPSKLGPFVDRIAARSARIWLIGSSFMKRRFLRPDWSALREKLLASGYRVIESHRSHGAALLLFERVPPVAGT